MLDSVTGRARGLGDVLVWWLPNVPEDSSSLARSLLREGRITDCPRADSNRERLVEIAGGDKVEENLEVVDIDIF